MGELIIGATIMLIGVVVGAALMMSKDRDD